MSKSSKEKAEWKHNKDLPAPDGPAKHRSNKKKGKWIVEVNLTLNNEDRWVILNRYQSMEIAERVVKEQNKKGYFQHRIKK